MAPTKQSGSTYHMPLINTTTDPITKQPWSAADKAQVAKLNELAVQFADAVRTGHTQRAQDLLQQRDTILNSADQDVQAGFLAVGMSSLIGAFAPSVYGE